MFLVGLISWWYGRGWIDQWGRAGRQFSDTLNFFSITYLFRTFFSPFRQISANDSSGGTLGDAARAFLDRLFSRMVGSVIRFFTILVGLVVIALQAVYQAVVMVAWWLVPVMPLVGAVLFAVGWVPTWM